MSYASFQQIKQELRDSGYSLASMNFLCAPNAQYELTVDFFHNGTGLTSGPRILELYFGHCQMSWNTITHISNIIEVT